MEKYNIAIVDDHKLFRAGLITLLEGAVSINQIHEASNGEEFIDLLQRAPIDIVLMDIEMPGMDGIETSSKALTLKPDLKIISLSMYNDDEYYYKMINAGVKGFLAKDSDIEEVLNAIQEVGKGEKYFSSERLYEILKKAGNYVYKHQLLTDREQEVLNLICKGLSNHEIAELLCLSKRTVDKHRENILSKTGCKNTASLIMFANNNNLIQK